MDNKLFELIQTRISPILGENFELNMVSRFVLSGPFLEHIDYKGKSGTLPWERWTCEFCTRAHSFSGAVYEFKDFFYPVFMAFKCSLMTIIVQKRNYAVFGPSL